MAGERLGLNDFFHALQDVGVTGSVSAAFRQVDVYAAVTLIADQIALVPQRLYRREDDGSRSPQPDHPLQRLVEFPNERQSAHTLARMVMLYLAGHGNSFVAILRNSAGMPDELVPLQATDVTIEELPSGDFFYRVSTEAGSAEISRENMLHFVGYSFDGIRGISPIQFHKDLINLGRSQLTYADSFYQNAARFSGTLETDAILKEDQVRSMEERFSAAYSEAGTREGRIAVLTGGLKFSPVSPVPPTDADFVNASRMSTEDIFRIFRVPTSAVGLGEHATLSNVETFQRQMLAQTLDPYLRQVSAELTRKLIRRRDRGRLYFEGDTSAYIEANVTERYNAYQKGITAGWLSGNEVRTQENLPNVKGLEVPYRPLNLVPVDEEVPSEPTTEPAPSADESSDESSERARAYNWQNGGFR